MRATKCNGKNPVQYQLVPPHTHRANAAEGAIQTFKNHFKSGLASLHPDFPVAEWDRLLDQAFISQPAPYGYS